MTRENVETKGRRYVSEGRLTVTTVNPDQVAATVRGGGATYRCGHNRGIGWWCTCPAKTRCAHLVALQLVTIRPPVQTVCTTKTAAKETVSTQKKPPASERFGTKKQQGLQRLHDEKAAAATDPTSSAIRQRDGEDPMRRGAVGDPWNRPHKQVVR
jgi:uncharacterized Zn finger protein